MAKDLPTVVTANDLRAGCVVYFTESGTWSPFLRDAALLPRAEAEARLALAQADSARVVGAYLAEALPGPRAADRREALRASGPTNYPHRHRLREAAHV